MIVEMTKKQILEVLRKEPLTHGVYAEWPINVSGSAPADTKGCSFCAVGQIVRAAMAKNTPLFKVNEAAYSRAESQLLVEMERVFEDTPHPLGRVLDEGAGREAAIDFVKKNFPARVRLNIGSAKPRRGMKIVAR